MNQPEFGFMQPAKKRKLRKSPAEYKVVALRDCPLPPQWETCETPSVAVGYWQKHVVEHPYFNPETECLVVLLLNTRKKIKGHCLVSTGTLETILVHAREVFRPALVAAASAIVLMHNHPSGDPSPSEADIKVTRDLIRAGQLLKVEVLDHVIVGHRGTQRYVSLRELGYFAC